MMTKLIFYLNNAMLNEFTLNNERTTIGRRATNDIQIDNLAVSGEHAVILKKGDDFYIEDCESTNGTEVNGKLVKSQLLQPGDLIVFGKHQLKFINEVKFQSQSKSAFEKTILMRSDEFKEIMSEPAPLPSSITPVAIMPVISTPEDPSFALGKIQVLNGSSVGRELVLNKTLTTLGKKGVQVAVITKRPHGYFITHVEGKVLPSINGAPIGAQAYLLSDHDVIELANVKMEFYFDKH
jgi:pSer/pThr/pTyr-binding forkhead associated (FHA) protein